MDRIRLGCRQAAAGKGGEIQRPLPRADYRAEAAAARSGGSASEGIRRGEEAVTWPASDISRARPGFFGGGCARLNT